MSSLKARETLYFTPWAKTVAVLKYSIFDVVH